MHPTARVRASACTSVGHPTASFMPPTSHRSGGLSRRPSPPVRLLSSSRAALSPRRQRVVDRCRCHVALVGSAFSGSIDACGPACLWPCPTHVVVVRVARGGGLSRHARHACHVRHTFGGDVLASTQSPVMVRSVADGVLCIDGLDVIGPLVSIFYGVPYYSVFNDDM